MKLQRLLPIVWIAFALAWLLQVHADGVTFPKGLPGWEAFRIAAAAVWPLEGVEYETWWGRTLAALSAGSNLVMIVSLGARRRGRLFRRRLAITSLVAFCVNAQWLFFNTEMADVRAGYYLWWLSFLALGCVLLSGVVAPPARSLEDAG